MDTLDRFDQVADAVTAIAMRAMPYRLLGPSPCTGWSRRDVLNHMVGAAALFAAPARGEPTSFPDWSAMPDWLGSDPAVAYRDAADGVLAAYGAPGVLCGTVAMPWGEMPAPVALDMLTADHVTHVWDLTHGTDLAVELDDAIVEAALATSHSLVSPEFRAAGFYGAEQPAPSDAPALDRLAAFAGRPLRRR